MLLVGAVLLGVVAAGCEVQTVVTVDVDEDGSGTVEVAVGLDEEAMAEVPDLDGSGTGDPPDLTELVRADDLVASGWELGEPEAGDDGVTWVRLTRRFGTPEEAGQILAELTGDTGLLRDLQLTRETGFGSDSYRFSGTADLSAGLEAFGDPELAMTLDGETLGEDVAAIEERLGRPVAEMATFDVEVLLPGGDTASFSPELGGEPVDMSAETTLYHWPVLLLAAVAVVCVVALLVVVAWRLVQRQRA